MVPLVVYALLSIADIWPAVTTGSLTTGAVGFGGILAMIGIPFGVVIAAVSTPVKES